MDKNIDCKEKLFSLLDKLSDDIKTTCDSMEAKMHPGTQNCNYAYLYDHLITCLSVHLSDDEMKKLVGEDYENKHKNYKKLLYEALDKYLSPDDKQDILAIFKKMEKQILSQQIHIADKEALEKYLNEQDDKKFNDLQDIHKEIINEKLITMHYKDLYDLFKRDMHSYVEFKADLAKLKRLLFYRNNICARNEKWDKLIETEKKRIYNIIQPLINEGFSNHKGPQTLPYSLTNDPKEQTKIAKEIADELKNASFSHKVLNELSTFYKDIKNLNKTDKTSYKATAIKIKAATNADSIELKSPITLNVLKTEFKHQAEIGILTNYENSKIEKLIDEFKKAGEGYTKLAATIIKNIFNKHGVFTKKATNNDYGIKNQDGNLLQFPNYIMVIIYEILESLGLCAADIRGCKKFEDDTIQSKKEMVKKFVKDKYNDFGDIDVNKLFSDYHKYLILEFAMKKTK